MWVIASLAGTIRQLTLIFMMNYEQPVVVIQKRIEHLGLLRLRIIRWALITGPVVWWLPFLVIAFKAVFGYRCVSDLRIPFLLHQRAGQWIICATTNLGIEEVQPAH